MLAETPPQLHALQSSERVTHPQARHTKIKAPLCVCTNIKQRRHACPRRFGCWGAGFSTITEGQGFEGLPLPILLSDGVCVCVCVERTLCARALPLSAKFTNSHLQFHGSKITHAELTHILPPASIDK